MLVRRTLAPRFALRVVLRRLVVLGLLAGPAPLLCAQPTPDLSAVRRQVEQLEQAPALQPAGWGVVVKSVRTGQTLLDVHGQRALMPASTLKLLTSATALLVLGADFRYATRLAYGGTPAADGTLNGPLYLRGSGDPSLGSDRFEGYPAGQALLQAWADTLWRRGLRRVTGPLVVDDGVFDVNLPDGWSWQDIGNYYGTGAYGLNFAENLYALHFRPGQAGRPAVVTGTTPALPEVRFDNHVLTGPAGSGDQAYIYGAPFSPYRYLGGTVPADFDTFTIKGALPDPPQHVGRLLLAALAARGIAVEGGLAPRGELPAGAGSSTVVYQHHSPPVHALVRALNTHSLNLYAEALLKSVGQARRQTGTTAAGLAVVAETWRARGLPLAAGYHQDDGSGLALTNTLTPALLADLCVQMAGNEDFYASLPVMGETGTLASMGRNGAAAGNVRAKSGSLGGVLCYAGYVTTRSGERLAFALMANHYEGGYRQMRTRWERIMVALAEVL